MKKILVINFFPAFFPPTSGGELRYYNMYKELSTYYDITLLSPTHSDYQMEIITHSETFREHRVPKNNIFNELHWKLDGQHVSSEVSALVCALSSEYKNEYHLKYLELYDDCDIIIHEFPYMLRYDLFFGMDDKPRIYNSHNYESDLVSQIWAGPYADKYLKLIHDMEGELVNKCDLVFATCEEDRNRFIADYGADKTKIKVAPNGINPQEYLMRDDFHDPDENSVMFIGSAHPPNIEAVEFIVNNVADKCKDIIFKIAGSCSKMVKATNKPNVQLLGFVSQEEKDSLFRNSKCAINPMFSGSGTNLKTLEFFSSGIPLLSTEIGVRGLKVVDGEHYFLADGKNFAEKLNSFMNETSAKRDKIAKDGRQHINKHFSWEGIAKYVRHEIEKIPEKKHTPTLLLLNDFSAASPKAGGEVRINYLYKNVSYRYKVVHLCLNDESKIKQSQITPRFWEISIPKTSKHLLEQQESQTKHQVSVNDIITSYMCKKNHFLVKCFDKLSSFSDCVVLIHPYMAKMVNEKRELPIIYESLNSERDLKSSLLVGHPDYTHLCNIVSEVESHAIRVSDLIVTCSREELYKNSWKPVFVVENGVEIPINRKPNDLTILKEKFDGHPIAVFVGSGHFPNVEAVDFIAKSLAQQLPNIYFMIVGSVCEPFTQQELPNNVLLMGTVSDDEKQALMQLSDFALNPMISGAGSNLKLADYFSAKLPTITTPIGKRGYDIRHETHALICDLEGFASAINALCSNNEFAEKLAENAFKYVFLNLDWRTLARKYVDIIDKHILDRNKKKILIVTYRINHPEKGGAEVYLSNILRNINSEDVGYIDVAALNIGGFLTNYKHYSIQYDYDSDLHNNVYFDKQVYKFNIDSLPEDIIDKNCRTLFSMRTEDTRIASQKLVDNYSYPLLMGGWHYPENADGTTSIWSSTKALIYCDGIESITFLGSSPIKQKISLRQSSNVLYKGNVKGQFKITCDVIASEPILELHSSLYSADDDIRELGIHITKITYKTNNETHLLPLDYNFKDYIIEHDIDSYVNELICIANSRDIQYDHLFNSTRGPNSIEMEMWLDTNIKNYDVVLVHNVPYATTLLGAEYAKKYEVPFVALPHFHFDDDFYHWNSIYELFKQANAIITAPEISEELFYQKISPNNLISLPGGGVNLSEYSTIDTAQFKDIYNCDLPFVLVLGRKSSAKNYIDVVSAVEQVNSDSRKINLIMIGPEEDGIDLTGRDVIYFGMQPREVVLGALGQCLVVVNMSESESFGIVILEAWAVKRPVIVNKNCFAFTELVENGVNGLTCSRNNVSESIIELMANPERGDRMGVAGNEKLKENYTWEKIAVSFVSLFNREDGNNYI